MPMHQMYLKPGADPDWVIYFDVGFTQINVIAEVLLCWELDQNNVFLTRQVTSIILMGLVQYFKDLDGDLKLGDRNVYFHWTPHHLRKFAQEAFAPLGWSRDDCIPSYDAFNRHSGCKLIPPSPNVTHP